MQCIINSNNVFCLNETIKKFIRDTESYTGKQSGDVFTVSNTFDCVKDCISSSTCLAYQIAEIHANQWNCRYFSEIVEPPTSIPPVLGFKRTIGIKPQNDEMKDLAKIISNHQKDKTCCEYVEVTVTHHEVQQYRQEKFVMEKVLSNEFNGYDGFAQYVRSWRNDPGWSSIPDFRSSDIISIDK